MKLVENVEQLLASTLTFDAYREASNAEKKFYKDRLRLGKIFVVTTLEGRTIFCPSRFAGYEDNTMIKHIAFEDKSGSVTTPHISHLLGSSHAKDSEAEKEYRALCNRLGITPSSKTRTYWTLKYSDPPSPTKKTPAPDPDFPDDVAPSGSYPEGTVKQILVNAYERNPKARQACIDRYGATCSVCTFDFESRYGVIGRGFIHVHHLYPLSLKDEEYEVDPIKDLRPVCPNCHAMLHKNDPPFTIDELREVISSLRRIGTQPTVQADGPAFGGPTA